MMYILATHPELADRLRETPDAVEGFIDESLRYFTPIQGRYRRATQDVCLHGQDIPAQTRLHFSLGSANYDDRVFEQPERFDPDRTNARDHLAFGHGIHFCVGSEVARTECRIALKLLLGAMTGIRLANPAEPPAWGRHFHIRGLERLDVVFDRPA